MFTQFAKAVTSVTIVTVLGMGAALAQAPAKEKKVKDQGEYDLYSQAGKETDAAKRLPVLDSWKEKYPETDFKEERLIIYLSTYQALNQTLKAVEAAKEILAANPREVNALFFLTRYGQIQPPTPDSLATGEKAAMSLPDAEKPANVADAAWAGAKANFALTSLQTLAFIAVHKKEFDKAEKTYGKILETNPTDAQTSYALGSAILAQKKPERYPEALFHIARAASITGTGALPPAVQKPADAFLVKNYNLYHGSDEGLKELRQLAVGPKPMPPSDFTIKDKNTLAAEEEKRFAESNPQLHFWKNMRDALTADNGEMYFESGVKGASLPPESVGKKLKGKLVSMKPALRPKELTLEIEPGKPEVILKFENNLPGKAEVGTDIEFEGIAESFTKSPFTLTLTVEDKDKITGWPAAAAAPAGKKTPSAGKKAPAKK